MTFSFYHSLISQPPELDEAARLYPADEVAAVLEASRCRGR